MLWLIHRALNMAAMFADAGIERYRAPRGKA